MIVVDADDVPLPTVDAQANEVSQNWGWQFSETRVVDLEVARAKLQHCAVLPHRHR